MASDEHLAMLRPGVAAWNDWRRRYPYMRPDLSGADLGGANLGGADLTGVDLSGADLGRADLSAAHLNGANLTRTDLREANLRGADLGTADLTEATLYGATLFGTTFFGADLTGADFTSAALLETIFIDLNLEKAVGLDQCKHIGPSTIDFRTLSQSRHLSIAFLRGCGLPESLIGYLPALCGQAIHFYSCFISYSTKDEAFADRLHADLQNKGIRCWFAPHDLPIGAKTWDAIDEAIRLRDKLLVILSKASIGSDWVEDEVNKAFAEERSRKAPVLFPIRIDNTVMSTGEAWAAKLREQRNIGDFRQWKNPAGYQKSLERLLRDLRTTPV